MSNGDMGEQDKQDGGKVSDTWLKKGRSAVSNHRFGAKLGVDRTDVAKESLVKQLSKLKPQLERARVIGELIATKHNEANETQPDSELAADLARLSSETQELGQQLNEQRLAVTAAAEQKKFHIGLAAIQVAAETAQQISAKQGELFRILALHDQDLPSSLTGEKRDPLPGEAAFEEDLKRLRPAVGLALSHVSTCQPLREAQQTLDAAFQESLSARIDGDIDGAVFMLSVAETRLQAVDTLVAAWNEYEQLLAADSPLYDRVRQLDAEEGGKQAEYQTRTQDALDLAQQAAESGDFLKAKVQLRVARAMAVNADVELDKQRFEAAELLLADARDEILARIAAKPWGDPPSESARLLIIQFEESRNDVFEASQKKSFVEAYDLLEPFRDSIEAIRQFDLEQAASFLEAHLGDDPADKSVRKNVKEKLAVDPEFLRVVGKVEGGLRFIDSLVEGLDGAASSNADKKLVIAALEGRYNIELKKGIACTCGKLQGESEAGNTCDTCGDVVESAKWTTNALPRLYKVLGMVPESHVRGNPSMKKLVREKHVEASWYDDKNKAIVLNAPRSGGVIGLGQDLVQAYLDRCRTGKGPLIASFFDGTTLHEVAHAVDDKFSFMARRQSMKPFGGWRKPTPEELVDVMGDGLHFYADWSHYSREFLEKYLGIVVNRENPAQDNSLQLTWRVQVGKAGRLPEKQSVLDHPVTAAAEQLQAMLRQLDPKPKQLADLDQASDLGQAALAIRNRCRELGDIALMIDLLDLILFGNRPAQAVVDDFFAKLGTVTDRNSEPDWRGLAQHAAVEWFRKVTLRGEDDGLWDDGNGGATKYAVKGRVYQEAYRNSWWSYELQARNSIVTNYQFRAPGEWFAEAYAAFFQERLPDKHPVAVWLRKEVERDALNN